MLSDWTRDLVAMNAGVSPTLPLVGSSSVILQQTAFTARYFLSPTPASTYPKGLEHGRLRTLIRFNRVGTEYKMGLACLGSANTLATVAGNCYVAWFYGATVLLGRVSGVQLESWVTLRSVAFTSTINTIYALQLDWRVNQGPQNATWLSLSVGTALDFSNLTVLLSHSDASVSKISSGNYEGPVGCTGSSTMVTVEYDQTQLCSPTP